MVRQAQVDAAKGKSARNRMGQFATPAALAREVVAAGLAELGSETAVRFLDPAIGTGSFYSALIDVCGERVVESATGIEIDPDYGDWCREIWGATGLEVVAGDFTKMPPPKPDHQKPNLLVCNPPYVRHHHMASSDKVRLQAEVAGATGIRCDGLSGLYCYFLGLCHKWMADDGIACWLIPAEFMDVNYGRAIREYLTTRVTLLRLHRFDPAEVQFDDALVSSVVLVIRNAVPGSDHAVEFSFGGSLLKPSQADSVPLRNLRASAKWSSVTRADVPAVEGESLRISDCFDVRRGLVTGGNSFFLLDPDTVKRLGIPATMLKPAIPGSRRVPLATIEAAPDGTPKVEPLQYLLDCRLPPEQVQANYPRLWEYLQQGVRDGVADTYLARHRDPWYLQEVRAPAPVLCTYIGRGRASDPRPFRFIHNTSKGICTNVWLMLYPKERLRGLFESDPEAAAEVVWRLNRIPIDRLTCEGRVYGGAMFKLEPKELGNLRVPEIAELLETVPSGKMRAPLGWDA